jgi:tripartite-type tricarboxylate transporter receptor subunit TctC
MKIVRTFGAILSAVALIAAVPSFAQDYPTKTIRLLVPYPTAGTTDPLSRMLAEALGKALGQTIVVENKPGANGNIGTAEAVKAAPDGYTLVVVSSGTLATNPALYKTMPFDVKRDLVPVATFSSVPNILVVNPSVPATTLAEFTAYVKANPGKVNFGSSGNGSSMHLAGELYRKMSGTEMTHVPYTQLSQGTTDLLSGQIQSMFQLVPGISQHVKAGSVRAIAVLGPRRNPALPNVPTSAEAGMPGLESSSWLGIMAPAGTPSAIVDKLNLEINAILKSPEIVKRYNDLGAETLVGSPEDFAKYLDVETRKWGEVVRFSGAKID